MKTEATTTEAQAADITALPPADRALIALNSTQTEKDLAALVEEAKPITEVKNQAGRDQAHALGMKMRRARTTIEKVGKAARDDANAFAKAVIGEEKRLIGMIEGEERRVMGLRDSYDAAIEAERAAKAAAEAARVAGIRANIDQLRALPISLAGEPSDVIWAAIQGLGNFSPDADTFAEFVEDAGAARHETIRALRELAVKAKAQEDAAAAALEAKRVADEALAKERAAIEAERAEMARIRKEHADALAAEQTRIANERAAFEAERKAFEASRVVLPVVDQAAPKADHFLDATKMIEATPHPTEQALQTLAQLGQEIEAAPTQAEAAPETLQGFGHLQDYRAYTVAQLAAVAGKIRRLGAGFTADELSALAKSMSEGQYDKAIYNFVFHMPAHDAAIAKFTNAAIEQLGEGTVGNALSIG